MSDDSSGGRLAWLKRTLQGAVLAHVPDHPAHGGNTGETEWSPDGADSRDEESE